MNKQHALELITSAKVEAENELAAAQSLNDIENLKTRFLGKQSVVRVVNSAIKNLDPADRPILGQALAKYREDLSLAFDGRASLIGESEQANAFAAEAEDLTLNPLGIPRGHSHLISQLIIKLQDIFTDLGYTVSDGPEVESDWYNFEALNFPPGHPARDMQDTVYLDRGAEKEILLRTQTSSVQIRTMSTQPPPIYTVVTGRVYRSETSDARHSSVFHQIEALAVDDNITMADMFGTIEMFVKMYLGEHIKTRFLPSFFPFTEPSAECSASCIFCDQHGCRVCSHTGWIELGGCGMVDPNVFRAVNYDPEVVSGFAFGFGLERMIMLNHNINTMSTLWENDIRFLKQF